MTSKIVYSSESQLKQPVKLIKDVFYTLSKSYTLALQLCIRDIKVQYRQTFLGILWLVLPPVIVALSFWFARKENIINLGETGLPYIAYVILNMSLWQTFVESLQGPVKSFANAKTMIQKVKIPYEALILSKIGQTLFAYSIKIVLIIAVFLLYGINITISTIAGLLSVVSLVLFGAFVGTLLTPFAALYHDFSKMLVIITGFWLFLTPVLYPMPLTDGIFSRIVELNPVTPIFLSIQDLVTSGVISDLPRFIFINILALTGFFFSLIIYKLTMPFVIERMGA